MKGNIHSQDCLEAGNAASQFSMSGVGVNLIRAALQLSAWIFMSIDGKHFYRFSYLKSEHWQNLRLQKLASVDAVCKLCRKRDLCNDVHHLLYRGLYDVRLNDLVVLCRACHANVHAAIERCQRINNTEQSHARWHRTVRAIRKNQAIEKWKSEHAQDPQKKALFFQLRHFMVLNKTIPTHGFIKRPCGKRAWNRVFRQIKNDAQHFYELCEKLKLVSPNWPCGEH